MKDTTFTKELKKRELIVFVVCFIIACAINVYSIISFNRSWTELFSQMGFVFAITIALYIVSAIIRLIVHFIRKAIRK